MAFSPKALVTVSQQHSLGGVITDPYTVASSPWVKAPSLPLGQGHSLRIYITRLRASSAKQRSVKQQPGGEPGPDKPWGRWGGGGSLQLPAVRQPGGGRSHLLPPL